MTSRGVELLAELAAADAAIADCWTEWDREVCVPGGSPQVRRDAWSARLHQVEAARQAVAARTWEYFEDEATAEERAAWMLMSPSWHRGMTA